MTDPIQTLRWVLDRWPDLWESRFRGTARPWRQPDDIPTEVRMERDRLARIERIEADDRMPGYSLAPLHIDVLDTCADLLMTADLLHEHVAQTVGHPTLDHPATAQADPTPYLRYVIALLPEAMEADPDMREAATEKAEAMESMILVTLGEISDGQMLNAVCPFCMGVTSRHPSGGARTLRFRFEEIQDAKMGTLADPLIVCENPVGCTPFAAECAKWIKGKPAWRWPDWDWLAQRLIPAKAA